MGSTAKTALKTELPDLDSLKKLLDNKTRPGVTVSIGKTGGRNYTLNLENGKTVSCKFKHIEDHFKHLSKKESSQAANDSDQKLTRKQISKITTSLIEQHLKGEGELAKANKWVRFLTTMRQIFGNLFRPSHRKTLKNIFTDYLMPKTPQKATQEIYENLIKKLKEKKIQKNIALIVKEAEKAITETLKTGKESGPSDAAKAAITEIEEVEEFKSLQDLCKNDESEAIWVVNQLHKNHPKALKNLFLCSNITPKMIPMQKGLFSLVVNMARKEGQKDSDAGKVK